VFDLSALGVPRWVAGHDGWGFLQALRATPDGGAVIQTRLDGSQHVSALSGGVVITRTAGVVSPGDELVYAATWTDRSPSAPERVRCVVSGGTCAVTRVDQDTHAAVVRWTLPSEEGGYELIVAVGNSESFESARLGVAVHD
jgi:hypothetical protein